jgi:hypothetical protein
LAPRDLLLQQLTGTVGSLKLWQQSSASTTVSGLIQSVSAAVRGFANLDDPSHLYVRCVSCGVL